MNFTCPYCNRPTTITDPNHFKHWKKISISESKLGDVGLSIEAITCPNDKCSKLWLKVKLCKTLFEFGEWREDDTIYSWNLLPESEAKVLPDYILEAIRNDYYEACRIRDLSPKASATLARRCLQGMIRDFWSIKKDNLKQEIDELEDKVNNDTWVSIDAVRSVGNIGAHMEKDINIIIDVEPEEAKLLIGLIEQLVDDWYVVRHDRHERTEKLKSIVKKKKEQKKVKPE